MPLLLAVFLLKYTKKIRKQSQTNMKKDIHPKYFDATVTCACGNTFTVGSTREHINMEVCSQCHPFYTGKEKVVDTLGRIERFNKRLAKKSTTKKKKK